MNCKRAKMDVGSGSCKNSGPYDSLHGLKFGQKIYFEAAAVSGGGGGGGDKGRELGKEGTTADGGSRSKWAEEEPPGKPPPPAAPAKKGRSGTVPGGGGGGQPPRCIVEGCKLDLSDAKPYYSRHKVCGTHSKSPQVIVAGQLQRFCQQCSRFHHLPEFDQGKRSCRRRLAGHNERRRKPRPGSLLSTGCGALSSPFFETSSRTGSFLMDFSSYRGSYGKDSWVNARTSKRGTSNHHVTAMEKPHHHPWQNRHESPPDLLLQHLEATSSAYIASGIPSIECYTGGVSPDSSRALSLLSTQSWGSRNRQSSSFQVHGFLSANGIPKSGSSHGNANVYFPSFSLSGLKGCGIGSSPEVILPDPRVRQLSEAAPSQYSCCEVDASQPNEREYPGLEPSQGYKSPMQNMHWSL